MSADSGGSALPGGAHEEFPEIPLQIRKTIRGHVKVSVRVIIDQGGTVFAALVDSPGPSRYFDHMAIEAAKKWTFPPTDSSTRLKLVKFDFTRDGTTGQAEELQ
jgi:TonB family protein